MDNNAYKEKLTAKWEQLKADWQKAKAEAKEQQADMEIQEQIDSLQAQFDEMTSMADEKLSEWGAQVETKMHQLREQMDGDSTSSTRSTSQFEQTSQSR